jgi:PPOX class probable F420-dependent enzyme
MDGLTDELRDFLDAHRIGVLATIAGDGKPRQSVVYYARDGERLLISTESKRLKTRDVRSGWASLCVLGHEQPYPSAVFSGRAEILTEDIGPATASVMQRIAGMDERSRRRAARPSRASLRHARPHRRSSPARSSPAHAPPRPGPETRSR